MLILCRTAACEHSREEPKYLQAKIHLYHGGHGACTPQSRAHDGVGPRHAHSKDWSAGEAVAVPE
eukprot:534747-Pleurochrysis_carterae.AAC.3